MSFGEGTSVLEVRNPVLASVVLAERGLFVGVDEEECAGEPEEAVGLFCALGLVIAGRGYGYTRVRVRVSVREPVVTRVTRGHPGVLVCPGNFSGASLIISLYSDWMPLLPLDVFWGGLVLVFATTPFLRGFTQPATADGRTAGAMIATSDTRIVPDVDDEHEEGEIPTSPRAAAAYAYIITSNTPPSEPVPARSPSPPSNPMIFDSNHDVIAGLLRLLIFAHQAKVAHPAGLVLMQAVSRRRPRAPAAAASTPMPSPPPSLLLSSEPVSARSPSPPFTPVSKTPCTLHALRAVVWRGAVMSERAEGNPSTRHSPRVNIAGYPYPYGGCGPTAGKGAGSNLITRGTPALFTSNRSGPEDVRVFILTGAGIFSEAEIELLVARPLTFGGVNVIATREA
ncbi:hypothetical protein BDZ89DRAFT_1213103 [Hymenopellis radicata]|nr:hypothetical protein BDZ89DRAFT_1213103 [Hymenopellis radicata]